MATARPTLYLVDGHGLIFRAHFALIRNPLYTSTGFNSSAVYGFTNMLFKLMKDWEPQFLAMAFDVKGKTFRHELYEKYKAHRPKTPPEIIEQEPYIRQIVSAMNVKILEKQGYEADDILATVGLAAVKQGFSVIILTNDKDAYQLISPHIKVLSPTKGISDMELMNDEKVVEKFGVAPEQIVDYLSLVGDTSDNVPGVPSVGPKTAVKLLQDFGTLENILANIPSLKREKLRQTMLLHKESALMSKQLVILDDNIPLEFEIQAMRVQDYDMAQLRSIFKKLEFKDFQKQMMPRVQRDPSRYLCVDDQQAFQDLLHRLQNVEVICLDVETDDVDPFTTKLVGLSLSFEPHQAYYIPLGHQLEKERQLDQAYVLEQLAPILAQDTIFKVGHNIKFDWEVLHSHGVELNGVTDDTMVAAYLLKPERRKHNLDALTVEYLDERKTPIESLIGKGSKALTMDMVPIDMVCPYACEDVDTTFRLRTILLEEMKNLELLPLYHDIEIPLIPVLLRMEKAGVKVDADFLQSLERDFSARLIRLEEEIYAEAGESFNINSPKQLSYILFDKLTYPTKGIRKTSLGHSTDEGALHKLIKPNLGFRQLPEILLDYRSLTKLLNTYVIALQKMIDPASGRIHTSYNQTVTETGRLSSSDPNLQNIPIRTELGREIRKAFIAENADWLILSADYSQIELRILAHVAHDESMIKAFLEGKDIHAHTASEIFAVPLAKVTKEHRRMAKTINFGIDYGMTEWGLSARLNVPVNQARLFIKNYLNRYAGVRKYIDETIDFASTHGYVKTLFNRRRSLPEINAQRRNVRENPRHPRSMPQ
ncbi:DNA polymerase I [candidate division CSSED10-310 bacterium]|uniref:DNA polymerase I n=1 Tax=candidate division CSSED10-310 bacterium TaxID=2855610 RepID=A0ABV6Z4A4_UNCC1